MRQVLVGKCHLHTSKSELDAFLKKTYLLFYKKEQLRHLARQDKRLPKIKVTEDIFSASIFFKDKTKKELRLFLDGTIFLQQMLITTISIEGEEFSAQESRAIIDLLKALSLSAGGYILVSVNNHFGRIKEGRFDDYRTLLGEVYHTRPEERTEEMTNVYEWLMQAELEHPEKD